MPLHMLLCSTRSTTPSSPQRRRAARRLPSMLCACPHPMPRPRIWLPHLWAMCGWSIRHGRASDADPGRSISSFLCRHRSTLERTLRRLVASLAWQEQQP
eukprot:366206-Chlamydomonas_euryale.AAC.4